jgi:hypothetical protein
VEQAPGIRGWRPFNAYDSQVGELRTPPAYGDWIGLLFGANVLVGLPVCGAQNCLGPKNQPLFG